MRLTAADGLSVDVASDGTVTVGLDGEDWFGPGRPSLPASVGEPATAIDELGDAMSVTVVEGDVRCSVRVYDTRPLLVFRCEATTDLADIATGAFDRPLSHGQLSHQTKEPKATHRTACARSSSNTASSRFRAMRDLRSTAGSCSHTDPPRAGRCCSLEATAGRFWSLPSMRSTNRPSA